MGRDGQETMDWVTEWRSVTDEVVVMTAPPESCVCVCVCVNHVRGVYSYDLRDDLNTNTHKRTQADTDRDRQTDRQTLMAD